MKMKLNIILGCAFCIISMQANALQITASSCPTDTGSSSTYYTDSGGTSWVCCTSEGGYLEPLGNSGNSKVIKNPDADNVYSITGILVDLYYKNEVDSGETGSGGWANHYDVSYANTYNNPEDAVISWTGGSALSCPECFILVKDGSTTPGWYLFDIGYWDGMDSIELMDFWVGNGAISHVSLFAARGQVPEPSPLALMAIAMLGISLRSLFANNVYRK